MAAPKNKRPAKPRYRQLAETLMADIRSGRLAVGERMPGELDLVEQFKVSRHTVRESLRVLEELGLIARHQGLGTVVQARTSSPSYVQLVRSPAELMQYPDDSRLTVIETEDVRANRALAKQLKSRTGSHWTRIGAVRRQRDSGLAIVWTDIFVLPEYAGIARRIGRSTRPVYELIEREYDEQIDSVEVDIEAGALSELHASRLDADPGAPSMIVTRRYLGRGQRQFEVSVSVHPADRFNYSLKLKRGWQSGSGWVQEG
ncbi:MAG: GntR family transcriptional regulator [Pseudomonadota bacterium]